MMRLIGRSLLGLLVALQAVQPSFACSCELIIDSSCGCATECGSCESVAVEDTCNSCGAIDESAPCGCEGEALNAPNPASSDAQPAEIKKHDPLTPPVKQVPSEVTPAPALETPTTGLPAAPINVPSEPAAAPPTSEVFPGPAAQNAPAQTPAVEPQSDSGGLFDEPVPAAAPDDLTPPSETTPAVEETNEVTTKTEDLFVEPSQAASEAGSSEPASAEEATETQSETAESESTQEPATESDPLDDLFAPSSPSTEPAPETKPETKDTESEKPEKPEDPFDPFGQNILPDELHAPGGLASVGFRNWSNRIASFSCEARLLRLTADGAFLKLSSGEIVAMSFSQLSDTDLTFVRGQVRAQRLVLARTVGTVQLASQSAK